MSSLTATGLIFFEFLDDVVCIFQRQTDGRIGLIREPVDPEKIDECLKQTYGPLTEHVILHTSRKDKKFRNVTFAVNLRSNSPTLSTILRKPGLCLLTKQEVIDTFIKGTSRNEYCTNAQATIHLFCDHKFIGFEKILE